MKTQCQHCEKLFKIPDIYKNKKVRCPVCRESFVAKEFVKPSKSEAAARGINEIFGGIGGNCYSCLSDSIGSMLAAL